MNNVIEVEAFTKEQIRNTYRYSISSEYFGKHYHHNRGKYTFKKIVTLTIWTVEKVKEWTYPKGKFWGLFGHKRKIETQNPQIYVIKKSIHRDYNCITSYDYERKVKEFKKDNKDFNPFNDLEKILNIATKKAFNDLEILKAEKHLKEAYNNEEYLKLLPYQQEILSYLSTNEHD